MAITPEQNSELTDILMAIEADMDGLNDWETKFAKDQIERHKTYGQAIFMSTKQWDSIRKIYAKVTGEEDEPPPVDQYDAFRS